MNLTANRVLMHLFMGVIVYLLLTIVDPTPDKWTTRLVITLVIVLFCMFLDAFGVGIKYIKDILCGCRPIQLLPYCEPRGSSSSSGDDKTFSEKVNDNWENRLENSSVSLFTK